MHEKQPRDNRHQHHRVGSAQPFDQRDVALDAAKARARSPVADLAM